VPRAPVLIYSYLMCSQAIDQNIFPKVLGTPQCSIARSQHWAVPTTEGKIILVYWLTTH